MNGLRYDESLSISEDLDFYLRLLMQGLRARVLPDPMYGYRRHAATLSHRLSVTAVKQMIAAQEGFAAEQDRDLRPLLDKRMKALNKALAYERLGEAIKQWARPPH